MGNITTALLRFGAVTKTQPLYQYDYGQILKFTGVNLPATYEVHFSNAQHGVATTMIGGSDGVTIPDMYLTTGSDVYVWLYLHTGNADGETEYNVIVPVIRRASISDAPPTPVQQDVITQAIAALNSATEHIDAADAAAENADEKAALAAGKAELADQAASSANAAATLANDKAALANEKAVLADQKATAANTAASAATTAAQNANNAATYVAPVEASSTASADHIPGTSSEYFIYNGSLCAATANIAIGDTLAATGTGANITQVTSGAMGEVAGLNSALSEASVGNDETFTVSQTGANYFQKPVHIGIRYTFTNNTSNICSLFLFHTYSSSKSISVSIASGASVTFVSDDEYAFIGGTYQGTGTVKLQSTGINDLIDDVDDIKEAEAETSIILSENDLKRISVPFEFIGHWNIDSSGKITTSSTSQSSFDMYAVSVDDVSEIVCNPVPTMYAFYSSLPEVGSTAIDGKRYNPPAQGRITKITGTKYIAIRYDINTTGITVKDGQATKNATAIASTIQGRLSIQLEDYCKNLLFPIATIVDDDSNATYMPDIKAACDDEGIKCTFGVIYTTLQNDSVLLNLLKTYQEEGFHITSHPDIGDIWHTTDPGYDLPGCEAHVIKSLVYLKQQGFLDCDHLISPGGANGADLQQVYKKWCVSAVGSNNGQPNHLYGDGRYDIHRLFISPSTPLATYQTIIDAAYTANDWLIFGTHSWNFTTSEDIAFLKSVIEYAKTKGFVFQTYNEAYKTRKYLYDVDDMFN